MGNEERTWRVGEVAVATGLTVRALHHYDEIGLVVPPARTAAGHRLYLDADLRRLYMVTALRQLGLSLDQVAGVLAADVPVRDVIDEQLDQVGDALWPLGAGVLVAASCLRGKPVTFHMVRPMLTQGRPENRPMWDALWAADSGAPFRRCLRVLAVVWGVGLLAAGGLEVGLVFALSVDSVAAVPAIVHATTLPVLLAFTALCGKTTGFGVRRSLEAGEALNAETGAGCR